ncbi:hypothetical protein SKA34_13320 [Photobacterium sp. SKA34]|nr:hypothetical protein SKA34_13320 [Photobacterium sp. SKA34]
MQAQPWAVLLVHSTSYELIFHIKLIFYDKTLIQNLSNMEKSDFLISGPFAIRVLYLSDKIKGINTED